MSDDTVVLKTPPDAPRIHRLTAVTDTQIDALADVLIDCVEGGASVSFMHPLSRAQAESFWRSVADGVARNERALLVAEDAVGICGLRVDAARWPARNHHLLSSRARVSGLEGLSEDSLDGAPSSGDPASGDPASGDPESLLTVGFIFTGASS